MASKTGIEYVDATWNPWSGCTPISAGCANCYAKRIATRFKRDFSVVTRAPDKRFDEPLHWKTPKRILTCSASDFFHEGADAWRYRALQVIYKADWHTYLILTKRLQGIRERLPYIWPLDDVWLGATVEGELEKWRIDALRKIPAALRWLSIEPLLEDLGALNLKGIGWVVCGGESGPGARPMHPDWPRRIRDQCKAVGVPFFMKQQGEWEQARTLRGDDDEEPGDIGVFGVGNQPTILKESSGWGARSSGRLNACPLPSERVRIVDGITMVRVGKKQAPIPKDLQIKEYPK